MGTASQEQTGGLTKASSGRAVRIARVVTVLILLVLATLVGAFLWLARHTEPMLRARVIESLSRRFHSPVELDELHLSLRPGVLVRGSGLRILYLAGPTKPGASSAPMLNVRSFSFHSSVRQLLAPTLRVLTVEVDGAELHIPPKEDRGPRVRDDPAHRAQPAEGVLVDKIVIRGLKLVLDTHKPGAVPLTFDIANLTLDDVGRTQPFAYETTLRNPKPVGDIRSSGHFGPWQSDNPRDTALDGSFLLTHADLSTVKGLGGMLASNGKFEGTLGGITVDGVADVPDFRLTTGGHPLPLHADFHALVDGTTGNTTLAPVVARLAASTITATGSMTHRQGLPGHGVELDLTVNRGRIDDLLALAVRTWPPVVRGGLTARAHLSVPQGGGSVTRRMWLNGTFDIGGATWSNTRLQQQLDDLSERARGWPEKANREQAAAITAAMHGRFTLADEQVDTSEMTYTMPGAVVRVEGRYGLDGAALDFHGSVRTEATASEMVGGWKSLLVMPFDGLLKKQGAGMEVPFKLTGTQRDPKLDLDFGHKTPAVPLPH